MHDRMSDGVMPFLVQAESGLHMDGWRGVKKGRFPESYAEVNEAARFVVCNVNASD